jgi:adenylate cyclase
MPGAHQLREGVTLIGRSASCDLVISAPTISRQHARVRVRSGRVFVSDAGSTFGTLIDGQPITGERELVPGASFVIGHLQFTLAQDVEATNVLSDDHQAFEESHTIVRRVDAFGGDVPGRPSSIGAASLTPAGSVATATAQTDSRAPAVAQSMPATPPALLPVDRRSGDGRMLHLLTDISKTLVTVQPLQQVLARVVDLVFDVLPAERAFLLLRDSWDQPLTARVLRNRDGSVPSNVTISRTVVSHVMRDRVAVLAKDARYDSRLDASASIQAMNIRSFMCAPLWNRNDVIGVLYCDNPRSKQFVEEDLEVFTALCNYAAVAIEQARLSQQLLEETRRRERLQRYHSPGVVNRILHSATTVEGAFLTQERDVSVMFSDIVGFTRLCEHMPPVEIGDLLNSYFSRMAEVIFEHEGTLDKFIGDAILVVFGAPFDQPDHAERCVAAALDMRRELARLNAERGAAPIRIRTAINSGRALTGDIGSPRRKEFTTLGDVVNTASRLEANVAEPDQIVISSTTRALLGSAFNVRSLGHVKIRGRQSEVEAFEVVG